MRYRIETERGDLFDTSIIISMLVRISEDVPFGQMKAAFEKACRVHEVLNTKVVIEASGEAYYVTSDETHNGFEDTDKSIQELIDLNERKRFHIEDGEFIRGFKSADGILFMMHHLGGDGKSLLYFIETYRKDRDRRFQNIFQRPPQLGIRSRQSGTSLEVLDSAMGLGTLKYYRDDSL